MSNVSLHHVALWVRDLDEAAAFWSTCFLAEIGAPYHSLRRPGFVSRFATLPSGLRIEIMTGPWIAAGTPGTEHQGWDHIALSLGSREAVDTFATRCESLGYLVTSPRQTGDGFYEAIVSAPDGTRIEVTS